MIYLVRHGETEWNAVARYQGLLDSPLTESGEAQAVLVGWLLAQEIGADRMPIAAHVSPLGRTRATADAIARHVTLQRVDEPRLAEISLGSWDGRSRRDIERDDPDALRGADRFDWYFRAPDGESFDAAYARITSWLSDLTGPVVAVSHGLLGRLIRGAYLGLSKEEMLTLPAPQDGFFKLHDGRAELIGV